LPQIEAVIPPIQVRVDRLIPAAVEAVLIVEIPVPRPAPQEQFLRPVQIQPGVPQNLILPEHVVLTQPVVDREVPRRQVRPVVNQEPLIHRRDGVVPAVLAPPQLLHLPLEPLDTALGRGRHRMKRHRQTDDQDLGPHSGSPSAAL
jgi:hypothetical protein